MLFENAVHTVTTDIMCLIDFREVERRPLRGVGAA